MPEYEFVRAIEGVGSDARCGTDCNLGVPHGEFLVPLSRTAAATLMPATGSAAADTVERRPFAIAPGLLALLPSLFLLFVAVYGFSIWSGLISFTASAMVPVLKFVGFAQYGRLWGSDRWNLAVWNLAVFSVLFIAISIGLGLLLAILLDQKVRFENTLRAVFLYPMAISFIVTGVAWKWLLNPEYGLEHLMHQLGWQSFHFDWLVNPRRSIYTLVIAAVWQSSGFVVVLFLAGLRSVDKSIVNAARIDGAGPWLIYRAVILPTLRPVLLTVIVILLYNAIRSFDLVVALTGGGPGFSSDLPTTFMFNYAFSRAQLGEASASSVMILVAVAVVVVPYLVVELRHERRTQ